MSDQSADISWKENGVPVSERFDDPYFSLEDGMAETRHVFLDGNDLPARFVPGFHIAELGFGTGLNMLAALQAWQQSGAKGQLTYTSFEAFPMTAKQMRQALTSFPDLLSLADPFLQAWAMGRRHIQMPGLDATIIIGDARATLTGWSDTADAWFLDGFSPAKNPELWNDALLMDVGRHASRNGTCATYTAAGFVRRRLEAAGFDVERRPGFGRKRHMTVGRKQAL